MSDEEGVERVPRARRATRAPGRRRRAGRPGAGVKISAEETHKLVAKFSKELPTTTTSSSNTNPKKTPRFLDRISEETARALRFMSKLRYVTVRDRPGAHR